MWGIATAHIVGLTLGALLWAWLMHNRSVPLEGRCCCIWPLAKITWWYSLVALPVLYNAYPGWPHWPAWQARLIFWVLGFTWAIAEHASEYTIPLLVAAAVILVMIVDSGSLVYLEPCQSIFGLATWGILLES